MAAVLPLGPAVLFFHGPGKFFVEGGTGVIAGTVAWVGAVLVCGALLWYSRRRGLQVPRAAWSACAVAICVWIIPYGLLGLALVSSPYAPSGPWTMFAFASLVPAGTIAVAGIVPRRWIQDLRVAKVLVATVSTCLSLVTVEVLLAALSPPVETAPSVTTADGSYWYFRPGSFDRDGLEYRINSLGVRGPEFDASVEGPRVLLLGDSVPFGEGYEEAQVFPWLAGSMLSDGNERPVRVLNASLPSFSTGQISAFYRTHLRDVQCDVLVFAFYLDDVNRETRYKRGDILYTPAWPEWVQDLYHRLKLFGIAMQIVNFTDSTFVPYRERTYDEAWQDALSTLDRTRVLARERGQRFAVLDIPRFDWDGALETVEDYEHLAKSQELQSWCAARGIPYRSVLPALIGLDPDSFRLSSTDIHFTQHGHELAARVLADLLEELIN